MKKGIAVLLAVALLSMGLALAETAAAPVTFTFSENPTTGYTWVVKSSDETILTVADDGYTAAPNPDNAEGKGGAHAWTLKGVAEGDAIVTFTLGQAWEGGEVTDTLTYNCHVAADLSVTAAVADGIPELYIPTKAAIVLLENPTTGYTWAYEASAEGILVPEKDAFVAADAAKDGEMITGAGGYHVWVFNGAAEGDVTLTFRYARSWEEGVKPEATVTYTCHVDSALNVTLTELGGDYAEYDPMFAGVNP